jgi:hypothetical protein
MKYPDLINTPLLTSAVNYAFATNSIDNPIYLRNSKVYIFHGTLDNELVLGVSEKMNDFYSHYVPTSQIRMNLSIPASHAFVTKDFGNPCDYFGEPYMNNCNFDTAGTVLQWIYGPLRSPIQANLSSNLISMDQSSFVPFPWSIAEISMAKLGYVYIPTACHNTENSCKLHVALHGCLQNIDSIGFDFISHSGYNEWAEANNIIIIYPQTIASPSIPYNPKACWGTICPFFPALHFHGHEFMFKRISNLFLSYFSCGNPDWWGYTGPEYASQYAPQMQVIRGMMKVFAQV